MTLDTSIPVTDYDPFVAASASDPGPTANQDPGIPLGRYTAYTSHEFSKPRPRVEWVVESVIAKRTVSIVFGDAGSKKTWICFDLAASALYEKSWLGFKIQNVKVLYVDEDMGKNDLDNRGEMVWRGHNAPDFPFMVYTSLESNDLGHKSDQDNLENAIRLTGAELVIVDILRNVIPGRDEISAKDLQPVLFALRKIAERTGAAIILIHHENKTKGYSGTTALKGAVDHMIQVESKPGSDDIVFRMIKNRKGKCFDFNARANFTVDSFCLSPSLNPVKPVSTNTYNKAEKFTLLYLFNHGESTAKNITDSIDTNVDPAPKSVSNTLAASSKLRTEKLIERTDSGASGSIGTYALTKKGEREAESL